ncbi:MAG: hypothetical protein M3Z29_06735 [Pseudomonadota bacterium]|nr:hypothetical protein [Pseudomonadota bacterium]
MRDYPALWRVKAREEGRLRVLGRSERSDVKTDRSQLEAIDAWRHIGSALAASPHDADRELAADILRFLKRTPIVQTRDERGRNGALGDRQLDLGGSRWSAPARGPSKDRDLTR